MLTPRQIEEAADTLVPIWDELKEWITLDLIDRIMARLGSDDISLSRSELWRVEVFKDAGGLLDELQARIKRALGISDNELRRVFIDCGAKAAANDSAVYAHNTAPAAAQAHERARSEELLSADYRAPGGRTGSRNEKKQKRPLENISERMRDIMNDAYTRTSGELRNFTGTTADSVQVQFIRELDRAYLKVASGACSQWQAAQEAVDSIIDQQGTVTYPSGHVDTIEVAVIRAIRTGISRMSGALAIESALEHGLNHVLVSSHLGARVGSGEPGHDNHAWWQGKVYTIEGSSDKYPNLEQATGYPTDPRGLCGYNCRHNMQPFDPEVMINNTRQYDEEENEEAYNASQEMRRMERRLRKQSTAVKALERAEDICRDEELKESFRYDRELAEKRYEELKRSYLDYCSGHGVRPSYERLFTAKDRAGKTDNSSGGISTSVSVANSGNGGIIDTRNISSRNLPNGLRTAPSHVLSESEIGEIKKEIISICADERIFKFNTGHRTGYDDVLDEIRVRGDIIPDKDSNHPRDRMSSRAALAHEYYGHRAYRGTNVPNGSWNDEFRASYMAAKNCPNLTEEERRDLILDALERAKEAGVSIKYNDFIRRTLYGY